MGATSAVMVGLYGGCSGDAIYSLQCGIVVVAVIVAVAIVVVITVATTIVVAPIHRLHLFLGRFLHS